jgi:hypothetical protein
MSAAVGRLAGPGAQPAPQALPPAAAWCGESPSESADPSPPQRRRRCAHCQRGSSCRTWTFWVQRLSSQAQLPGGAPARLAPTDSSQRAGAVTSIYRADRRDVPGIRWPPGFWFSGPAPCRYSQPRAGRSATECERGRGLSALAGTPPCRLGASDYWAGRACAAFRSSSNAFRSASATWLSRVSFRCGA